jgi:hypothetical protein
MLQRPSANASAVFDSGARRVEQRSYERLEDIEDRFWWPSHHGSFPPGQTELKGTNVVNVYIGRLFRRLEGIGVTGVILGKTTRRCGRGPVQTFHVEASNGRGVPPLPDVDHGAGLLNSVFKK